MKKQKSRKQKKDKFGLRSALAHESAILDLRSKPNDRIAETASEQQAMELWEEVGELWNILEHRLDRGVHPRRLFRAALESGTSDSAPDLVPLKAARNAFYALPTHEQYRLLNGWRPVSDRPTLAQMREPMCEDGVHRVLEVTASSTDQFSPIERTTTFKIDTQNTFELDNGISAVKVSIREGTPHIRAMEMLAAILQKLTVEYDRLIKELPLGSEEGKGAVL